MGEGQKKFPLVEMLERIAGTLEIDTPELFSMQSCPADYLNRLRLEILESYQAI